MHCRVDCQGIAGNLKEDWSKTARALQEICRALQGNCKGTARSLWGPCLQGIFTALRIACRGTAETPPDDCKGGLLGIRRDTARGLRACGSSACKGSSMPCSAPAGEPQGNCKTGARRTPREYPRDMHETCRGLLRNGKGAAGMCGGSARGLQAIAANLQGICRVCKGGARATTGHIWSLPPQLATSDHFSYTCGA